MSKTKPTTPDAIPEIAPAPELLEKLLRLSAGHGTAADCTDALLHTVNRYLWDGSTFAEARTVGETLALRSLGEQAQALTDVSPHETPGAPQDQLLEEKFRVTASEIRHPRRVLSASSFLVSLLSQPISPGLKDGAERLIAHMKDTYPVESGIHDQNATEW
ncbi:MAG TPA: hypothetical protein H9903_06040 [Candidatus Aquabacterium excrementipullorum]|nr:hypothetical protein [Candidatus Aquabacterium excrementipullorum]